jgi:hypothetical protein
MQRVILSIELMLVKGSAINHFLRGVSRVSHQASEMSASSASLDPIEK